MKRSRLFANPSFIALAGFVIYLMWLSLPLSGQESDRVVLQKYKMLEPNLLKAEKYFVAKNWAKAQKELENSLKTLPTHYQAHFLLAQIHYQQGEYEQALDQMEAAKAGFSKMIQIVQQFQNEKIKLRQDEDIQNQEAINELYQNVVKDNCKTEASLHEINRIDTEMQAKDKPVQIKSSELKLQMPSEYCYWHGNCLFRLKKYADAETQYQQAIRIDPGNASAYNNLINLLFVQKRLDQAEQLIGQAESNGVAVNPELKRAVLRAKAK